MWSWRSSWERLFLIRWWDDGYPIACPLSYEDSVLTRRPFQWLYLSSRSLPSLTWRAKRSSFINMQQQNLGLTWIATRLKAQPGAINKLNTGAEIHPKSVTLSFERKTLSFCESSIEFANVWFGRRRFLRARGLWLIHLNRSGSNIWTGTNEAGFAGGLACPEASMFLLCGLGKVRCRGAGGSSGDKEEKAAGRGRCGVRSTNRQGKIQATLEDKIIRYYVLKR